MKGLIEFIKLVNHIQYLSPGIKLHWKFLLIYVNYVILLHFTIFTGGMGCSSSTGPQPGLTESHKSTIKKSWESFVSKGDLADIGMPMFLK